MKQPSSTKDLLRLAEARLAESELRFRTLADSGQALIWTAGLDKKCDYFNAVWLCFTGRTLEQEMGDGWAEGVHPEDFERCVKTYSDAFDRREAFSMEYRLRHASGEYRWLQDDGSPRYDREGRFIGYIGYCLDITGRVRAEQARQQSEDRYAKTLAAVNDGLWDWHVPTGEAYFSPLYYGILGYADREFPATYNSWRTLVHPEDIDRVEGELRQRVAASQSFSIDLRMKVKSGGWLWVCTRGKVIEREKSGQTVRMVGTLSDISGRKREEEDRLGIEHRFRLLFESMTSGFALHEIILGRDGTPCDYRFLQVNPAFEALTGLKAAVVLGKTVRQIMPQIEEEWIERYGRVVTTGKSVLFENYSRELDRHFQVMAYRPEPGRFAVIVNDITEQRRAYEKVKQEQNLNSVIIDSIPGTFYMLDETGKYARWNTYQRDAIVGKPEDQVAQTNALDTIHPEDREFIQSRIAHVLQCGGVETVEGRVLLRGGPEFRWLLMTGRRLVVDGHPFLIGIGIDITERKRVEQEMAQIHAELEAKVRERTRDLNEAQRIAHMGSWHMDVATGNVTWSDELYRMYGFDSSRPVPPYIEHQKLFKPESWERLRVVVERVRQEGVPYELELEMAREDGKPAWMWVRGEAVRDAQGNIVELRGVAQDITERQLVAAELFKAYAALEETIARRTSELSLANSALKTEISVRRRAEGDLQQRTKELQVKNRHLECLYELAHVIEKFGDRKRDLYRGLIPLLQKAIHWTVPPQVFVGVDDLSVSSAAKGEELVPEGAFPICVNGKNRGEIRLARRSQDPAVPLTADEVNLLGAVTERLGRLVVWFDALREVRERQLHLIQADKLASLGVMVAGVAHEINNPVNNIMLNASLLRDVVADALPILDDYRNRVGDFLAGGLPYSEMRLHIGELMNGILEGSERIKTITGDLRDSVPFSTEMSRESAQVNEVVATAVRMCSHMDKHFRERMVLSLEEGLPRVPGSHRRLEQVVINLIQNAWQALQNPEARIFATTRMDLTSGAVVVEVRDEGCGMSAEVLAHIKDPFFTTRRDKGGTGLGISVSNGIVEEMGGSLTFESAEGKGALARIRLPVQMEIRENP